MGRSLTKVIKSLLEQPPPHPKTSRFLTDLSFQTGNLFPGSLCNNIYNPDTPAPRAIALNNGIVRLI
ncbi:hypothetical protein [Anabaenopsis arnoldii]|uniref:Uncharacterized protein n=1 Tax=Anabaenopsis arnoldii TaxID=2152938 RepID=A0ABT5AVU4_9CYAN|nr:hypothetical protein [Anabaenopsis arnoldii]MDB9541390.1 hypothetical protein [Anabaenopsis arnoldii]MDH6090369.1 hypothetical protein [Anabaenopsis arnoldii]